MHLFLPLLALMFFTVAPVHAAPVIGQEAPIFTAIDSNGSAVSLAELAGKIVVLEWTNHACPYVKKHYETNNIQTLQKTYTSKDVVWLSVISSAEGKQGHVDGATANALTESRNASPTAVLLDEDGNLGRLYDAKTTPHLYIISSDGTLAYKGAIDDNSSARHSAVEGAENHVSNALDQLLAGEQVTIASTKPYGCSVKY